jgi:glutathione S-transferase
MGGAIMIVVHHLNDSRSQRILWLLEELGVPYEIKFYQRDPTTRFAPPKLKAVHPLGKAPVVTDDGRAIIESGAIIDYVIRRHGQGRLQPNPATPAYDDYVQWLHFAEGSAMLPLLLKRTCPGSVRRLRRLSHGSKARLPTISATSTAH